MQHATPDAPISKVRRWILECAGRVDDGALQAETNLLDEEYIDSLGLISLILFVEKLRGAPISEADMSAQNFFSLRQIEKTFFAAGKAPDTAAQSVKYA
jgi:acyl carrier protein